MELAVTIFIGIIGLLIGSFLNVVIFRLKAGTQFVKGRSICPHCKHVLSWRELIPLLSWLIQGGRCRHCRKPISLQYPAVEALTAALFILTYLTHVPSTYSDLLILLLWWYIIASFIILAVYDLRWYLLPDKVLLPIIVPAAVMIIAEAIITGSASVAYGPVVAAVVVGGFFYSLAAVSRGKWMGGGDIKLVFIIGLLLGIQKTAVAMVIAFISAAIIGVALIASHLKSRKDVIPFGPFLIAGTLVAYIYGGSIIHWYLNISGFNLLQ
jgi:prepilin signal peptidase PulO-like enzyme (type II secretory pathway)